MTQTGPGMDADPVARARFRKTLIRVMGVQVITLALLWLIQMRYAG